MNNYQNFEVKDWLEDRKFQDWVYLQESNSFWLNFLENTPHQISNMEQARSILLAVRGEAHSISPGEVKLKVAEILNKIPEEKVRVIPLWKSKWFLAASVILLIGLGSVSLYLKKSFGERELYYSMGKKSAGPELIEVKNKSQLVKMVNLPDGSSVILKKGGRIAYPKEFAKDRRDVFILGEVFFEVRKNPQQPFYVFAGEMLTKVTGTSFSIQANEDDDEITLVVKSGVVEVSTLEKEEQGKKIGGTKQILNPNQQVTFNKKSLALNKKNIENAVLLNLPVESHDFSFNRTKLKDVFSLLEKSYGLHIDFDQDLTANCSITAELGDEPVYEKLEMICAVINAKFEAKGGNIRVISAGCDGP
ncbi:FecR domain-containing protein [Dyadobacter sp. LHD-138]|uniref:FecR family protein n=1 Tax=Dyadobacter sp. LHD-138 TaxID=3071413 RepID=UPI0027E042A6|nr:FecR domain-containing protein [Dyadobacter sp. LHD-138]MDQ6477192.1 FecR domain-containing protein [Dyadobacter sp. LHD-138]